MIKLTNITKYYDDFYALKNINIDIKADSLTLLKGISGSGKSTLLSLLAGFIKPSEGKIVIDSINIAKTPDLHTSKFRRNIIGFVHQNFYLFNELNVYENIMIALLNQNMGNKIITIKIVDALKSVDMDKYLNQKVSTLSGGQKQRVTIARALVNSPKILLFDEPSANLDYHNKMLLLNIINKLRQNNTTIIIATHDEIFNKLDTIDNIIHIDKGIIIDR